MCTTGVTTRIAHEEAWEPLPEHSPRAYRLAGIGRLPPKAKCSVLTRGSTSRAPARCSTAASTEKCLKVYRIRLQRGGTAERHGCRPSFLRPRDMRERRRGRKWACPRRLLAERSPPLRNRQRTAHRSHPGARKRPSHKKKRPDHLVNAPRLRVVPLLHHVRCEHGRHDPVERDQCAEHSPWSRVAGAGSRHATCVIPPVARRRCQRSGAAPHA